MWLFCWWRYSWIIVSRVGMISVIVVSMISRWIVIHGWFFNIIVVVVMVITNWFIWKVIFNHWVV